MKAADRIVGIVLLVVYCVLFIGGLLGATNEILYRTVGIRDSISVHQISQANGDEFILSYTYFNKFTQKEYLVERSIEANQYERIKDKPYIDVRYVGYFPGSPHIEGVDSSAPLLFVGFGLIILPFVIRRNILFLRGKLSAQEFT